MFLFSRFFRLGVSLYAVVGRKRLLHLIAIAPFLLIFYFSRFLLKAVVSNPTAVVKGQHNNCEGFQIL